MKKIFPILFISLFIFSCDNLNCVEGNCQNGQGTLKYSGHTYVGEFKEGKRYGKGILTSSKGKVYDGEFNENLEPKVDYHIGFLINGTITEYYEDSNDIKVILGIVDGDVENFKTFDESGNLDMESISIDSLNSKIINYYKNGKVISYFKRLNTKILRQESTLSEYKLFYKNGNIYLEGYIDSSGKNQVNSWDKEGKQTLINGNGFYSTYYKESGILESSGPVKNGKLDQLWIHYNEDGSIQKEETYKDGELMETKEY